LSKGYHAASLLVKSVNVCYSINNLQNHAALGMVEGVVACGA
jgi:hypothetical protein